MNLTDHESRVLDALRQAGTAGLNSYSAFRKDNALQISGTIRKLKAKGYMIVAKRHKNRSVTYVLLHETNNAAQRISKPPRLEWVIVGNVARQVPVDETPEQGRLF